MAKRLLSEGRLPQKEVAQILRISGTWLGQQLREGSTTKTMEIPREILKPEKGRKR